MYLEMCLHYHGEVSVVCLGDILLVFAQFNCDNVAKVRTRIIPGRKKMRVLDTESKLIHNQWLKAKVHRRQHPNHLVRLLIVD